jgi:hypothetical protein
MSSNQIEPVIDNIILDDNQIISTDDLNKPDLVLFSSLKADAKPVVPYKIDLLSIQYPQGYMPKCAICNSPHRDLLEHVYIDNGKKINTTIKFFEKHFNAKLNWTQVNQHIKYHCDLNKIETPGLLYYEDREEEISKFKYREFDLAETILLMEINDVRGINAKTPDEILKRASMLEKLVGKLLLLKEKRDDNTLGLPNVFEVMGELHGLMVSEEDKRIIKEKVRQIRQSLA